MIDPAVEKEVYGFMNDEFLSCGCPVRIINGMPDHVHSLFRLNPQKALADVLKCVKGGSSHSINQQDLLKDKFSWQTGYSAFSVSESVLEKVYWYIYHQKKHHRKMPFDKEYDNIISLHGLDKEEEQKKRKRT